MPHACQYDTEIEMIAKHLKVHSPAIINAAICGIVLCVMCSINHTPYLLLAMFGVAVALFYSYNLKRWKLRRIVVVSLNVIFAAPVLYLFSLYSLATNLNEVSSLVKMERKKVSEEKFSYSISNGLRRVAVTENLKTQLMGNEGFWIKLMCPETIEQQYRNYVKVGSDIDTRNPWKGKRIFCSSYWVTMSYVMNSGHCTVYSDAVVFDSVKMRNGKVLLLKVSGNSEYAYLYKTP